LTVSAKAGAAVNSTAAHNEIASRFMLFPLPSMLFGIS
jgi:hypothetical protein